MSIRQRDFLMRQIEQLGELAAAVLGRRDSTEMIELNHEIARAQATLLGPLRDGFDKLDSKSVVLLLGGAPKARFAARLLSIEGDVREAEGDAKRATTLRRRALALFDSAGASDPSALADGDRALISTLKSRLELAK